MEEIAMYFNSFAMGLGSGLFTILYLNNLSKEFRILKYSGIMKVLIVIANIAVGLLSYEFIWSNQEMNLLMIASMTLVHFANTMLLLNVFYDIVEKKIDDLTIGFGIGALTINSLLFGGINEYLVILVIGILYAIIFLEIEIWKDIILLLIALGISYFSGSFALGIFIGFSVIYFIIGITQGKGMGGGDIRLGMFMGGGLGLNLIMYGFINTFIIGGIAALIFLAFGKRGEVPFGPFIGLGYFITLFLGNFITSIF